MRPSDYFGRIHCPLLIVDAVAPSQKADARLRQHIHDAELAIPQARVVWMPDTIHDIPWQRPRELAQIMLTPLP